MRVTAIDDDVALLQMWLKLLDECVYGRTGFYEQNDLSWSLELLAELLNRVSALDIGACNDFLKRASQQMLG